MHIENSDTFNWGKSPLGNAEHYSESILMDYLVGERDRLPTVSYDTDSKRYGIGEISLCLNAASASLAEEGADSALYGYTFFMLNKNFVTGTDVDTMAIRVRPGRNGKYELCLDINTHFFMMVCADAKQRATIIKHELLHVLLKHLEDRSLSEDGRVTPLMNIAFDLSINSILGSYTQDNGNDGTYSVDLKMFPFGIPSEIKVPKRSAVALSADDEGTLSWSVSNKSDESLFENVTVLFPAIFPLNREFKMLPPGLASETYYKLLQKNGVDAAAYMHILGSQHDWFAEVDPDDWRNASEDLQSAMHQIRSLVNDYIGAGTGSSSLLRALQRAWLPQPDYASILANFVATNTRERTESWVHLNRRGIDGYCGHHYENGFEVVVFIDQSGSMSDEHIERCFARLEGLLEHADITIYHFSDGIDYSSKHEIDSVSQLHPRRTVSGGTTVTDIFRFMKQEGKQYDVGFILTDMGIFDSVAPMYNVCFMYEYKEANRYELAQAEKFRSQGHLVIEVD